MLCSKTNTLLYLLYLLFVLLGLGIFVQNDNMTDWFISAPLNTDRLFGDGIALTKTNISQIKASFRSGKLPHT